MSSQHEYGELRPAYRTLNDPTRLLGLPIAALGGLIVAGLLGYGFLRVSPLAWKLNVSLVMVCVGAPTAILALRDASTIGPGRLLAGVLAWRTRPALVTALDDQRPVRRGGIRLTAAVADLDGDVEDPGSDELPWTRQHDALDDPDAAEPALQETTAR